MVGRRSSLRRLDIALLRLLEARVPALDPNTLDADTTASLFDAGVTMRQAAVGLASEVVSWL